MSKKTRKRLLVTVALLSLMVVLAACGTSTVTADSTNWWDRYVIYNSAQFIVWLSKFGGGNPGVGIILFTILIRIIILPLSYISIKNMSKTQEVAPQLKALQQKYSSKDIETQQKLRDETQKLYAKEGVNPMMGCLPMLVQMPFMFALYQAIYRTPQLKVGHFLWMNLAQPDPYWILPILAALFTAAATTVSVLSQPTRNASNWIMVAVSPIMILFMAGQFPSALSVYWVVTNAFQLVQSWFLQNPFKAKRKREEKAAAAKAAAKARRKAYKKALKK